MIIPKISKRWDKRAMVWHYTLGVGISMVIDSEVMEVSSGLAETYTTAAMVRRMQKEVATMQERMIQVVVVEEHSYLPINEPEE